VTLALRIAAFALFVSGFQVLAAPLYAFGGSPPHLALAATAYVALHAERPQGLLTAVLTGLCLDALSLEPWGAQLLALGLVGLVLRPDAGWTASASPPLRAVFVAAALAAAFVVRGAVFWVAEGELPPLGGESKALVSTIAAAWPVFLLCRRLDAVLLTSRAAVRI
jgi:rod shape-determining protein MreD